MCWTLDMILDISGLSYTWIFDIVEYVTGLHYQIGVDSYHPVSISNVLSKISSIDMFDLIDHWIFYWIQLNHSLWWICWFLPNLGLQDDHIPPVAEPLKIRPGRVAVLRGSGRAQRGHRLHAAWAKKSSRRVVVESCVVVCRKFGGHFTNDNGAFMDSWWNGMGFTWFSWDLSGIEWDFHDFHGILGGMEWDLHDFHGIWVELNGIFMIFMGFLVEWNGIFMIFMGFEWNWMGFSWFSWDSWWNGMGFTWFSWDLSGIEWDFHDFHGILGGMEWDFHDFHGIWVELNGIFMIFMDFLGDFMGPHRGRHSDTRGWSKGFVWTRKPLTFFGTTKLREEPTLV